MSGKTIIKVDYAEVGRLLNGEEMRTMLLDASADASRGLDLNDYEVNIVPIRTRLVSHIDAKTKRAMKDNFDNNTLLKRVFGGNK